MTMELRRSASVPLSPGTSRKAFFWRRGADSPSIDGDTLRQAIALPLRASRPHRQPSTAWPRAETRRLPDRMRRLRQVLLLSDATVTVGCFALAVSAGSFAMGVAVAVWFVTLLVPTLTAQQHDVHSLRRALQAGVLAVSVVSVTQVFAPGPGAQAARAVVALALGTLAALLVRLLVRAVPVAAVLGTDQDESVLLVGDRRSLQETIRQWSRCGVDNRIVGTCLTGAADGDVEEVEGVPVLGDMADAPGAALRTSAQTVAVLPGPDVSGESLRALSWALEPRGVELSMVTPLVDVASHRARTDVVGRALLVRVSHSVPAGLQAAVKSTLDRVLASLLLLVASPVLAAIALSVRLDSAGPALFRQQRVREGGRCFTMLKFRTMHVNAEEAQAALTALNDHGNGILFKMRNDPRVTRVGRLLRATSLDELPQLVNVLRGEMSLVGPRPALPSEVAKYDAVAHRRLAVKPGLTGLWQVSGRSNLSWDESLRVDLSYVDNWRHGVDFGILARTVKAVLRRDGAC